MVTHLPADRLLWWQRRAWLHSTPVYPASTPTPQVRRSTRKPRTAAAMKLSKEQFKQVEDAIRGGYDEPSLRRMVRVELGEDLAAVAGGDSLALRVRVFNLISWAERSDRIFDLIDGARAQVDTNVAVQQVWQASQRWRQPAGSQPDAQPIVHQCLQAVAALVGKEVGMVRLRFAKDPDDLRQDCFRSGPHIEWPGRQP